jgi:2',3'-cyclic-nucleotide 2'-phosphodiesterase (5'-nucleotidase family)
MKKITLGFLVLLLTLLSGCVSTEEPYEIDCTKYPTHVDCITDDDVDDDPLTCQEGYILYEDKCVYDLSNEENDYLEIYYINDFHGALEGDSDRLGIASIANMVNTRKAENPDQVLFVAGGDILQGSAVSNYYNGLSTINLLNLAQLDAFTVGNHEFDWGLDTILTYRDGDLENGEAAYPFLGANIFYEGTEEIPEGIEPYTIIEKGDRKIAIIGTIGYGLERSIAESKVSPYDFGDPVSEVAYYAEYLRTTENVDIIIVSAHDSGGSLNDDLLALTGNQRVDVIFNGHSHREYADVSNNTAILQAGSVGEFLGYVRLEFTSTGMTVTSENLDSSDSALLQNVDSSVQTKLDEYLLEIEDFIGEEIIISGDYYSSGDLSNWLADLMKHSTNADVAFHNYGGTRTSIDDGESITLGTLYEVWPFDNVIKTVLLPGDIVNNLVNNGGYATSTNITSFDPETLYLVATNDYIFDKTTNPFLDGQDIVYTGIIIRDLVQTELILQAVIYNEFYLDNILQTDLTTPDNSTTTQPN